MKCRMKLAAAALFLLPCAFACAQASPSGWTSTKVEANKGVTDVELLIAKAKNSSLLGGTEYGGLLNFMYGLSDNIGLNIKLGVTAISSFVETPSGGMTLANGAVFSAKDDTGNWMLEANAGYQVMEREKFSVMVYGGFGLFRIDGRNNGATATSGSTAEGEIRYKTVWYVQLGVQASFAATQSISIDPYLSLGIPFSNLWSNIFSSVLGPSEYDTSWLVTLGVNGTYKFSENWGVSIGLWWTHVSASWNLSPGSDDWNNYGLKAGVSYWF